VIEIDDEGSIARRVAAERHRRRARGGPVIPAWRTCIPTLFARDGGLAERMGSPEEQLLDLARVMYSFLKQLARPGRRDRVQLYCEMLKNGYTAVAEFHYLHNAPDGKPYANRVEMGEQHLLAAQRTGIAITLLPSLYAYGNSARSRSRRRRSASRRRPIRFSGWSRR